MRYSGLALSEVSPYELSHDSISHWLKHAHFRPREIWQIVKPHLDLTTAGILVADDTILSKSYSKPIESVHYQYSGNAHDVIAGIGLVNLLWHDLSSATSFPIDYRVYDKEAEGKTKHTHFCEMLSLAKSRGLKPEAVVMDAWYSRLKNLKAVRDHGWVWITTLRKNRKVNRNKHLGELEIPAEGLQVHLRGDGWVTVFKFVAKNGRIDYVATNMGDPTRETIVVITQARWSIEVYHRELKQTCGIERCQARTGRAQRNHIALSIIAWLDKHRRRSLEQISFYQQDWEIIKPGIALGVKSIMNTA